MAIALKASLGGFIMALCLGAAAQQAQPAGTAAPAPMQGASAPSDITMFTTVVTARRNPESPMDAVASAMSSPILGPIIIVGAYYMGVPAESIAGLAAASAAAAAEKANQARQEPRKGYQIFTITPPEGHVMCAVRFGAISIHPTKKKRPKVWATGSQDGVKLHVDHATQQWLNGRSTVKTFVDVIAVKTEAQAKYADKCFPKAEQQIVSLCRGSDCTPQMNRTIWLNGQPD